ncbi:LacI family transcriptional regulator [Echinicola pacifica]|uniref:LacI family transcriptional regulator n=1 Tax=Echinicola pacifica TaxID=346377 RepID=A0A918UKT2_9BACT|nr:LacI family DNA-binding transcriptional regulator [Echinicola pacifica]GGZ16907.1 LacI family transcriptional regulator [Echinicola pacifica]
MGKYVTITEIAKQLNLSHSTVSRALSNHPRISKKTCDIVQKLANELGYQANSTAHHLSKGESQIIAIIVPQLSLHFFSKVVEGIQKVLKETEYSLLLFSTDESLEEEIEAVKTCIKHRVDGVLVAISRETKTFDHFKQLLKHEVPMVFFDRVANFLPVPKVITNDYQASFDATDHLLKTGCKYIAHITGSINLNNSNNRLYGYLDALTSHEIKTRESLIHYYEFELSSIDEFLEKTLKKYPNLDGLFVFNDYVAHYAVNVLNKLGKRVPDDISVIGFSDEPVATYMSPKLSTVQQTAAKMGELAAQKIISILSKKEPMVSEKIIINPELILRETTKSLCDTADFSPK